MNILLWSCKDHKRPSPPPTRGMEVGLSEASYRATAATAPYKAWASGPG